MKKNLIIGALSTVAVSSLLVPSAAHAVERSCDAQIRVELQAFGEFPSRSKFIEVFSAKGSGNGPNEARRRARNRAQACAREVWAERWHNFPNGHGVPSECSPALRVYNFDLTNIKCEIYIAMCSLATTQGRMWHWPTYAKIWTRITGATSACHKAELHSENYFVPECSLTERQKVCPT